MELVDYAAAEEHVACTLRHQDGSTEHLRARYLAGCDGPRSSVRRLAGIPFEGGSYPQTFALGDLEVDGNLERGQRTPSLARGMLFFFPLGRPASWRMIGMRPAVPGAAEHEEPPEPSLADMQTLVDAFTGGELRLRDPVWLTYFRLHHRQAVHYRAGRLFVAGDAAHVHSPAGAQGMNTGIQDAWNLGWKLALVDRGLADEALLDSYEAERWPIGRFVLRFTDRATTIATSDSRVVRAIRTQVAPRLAPLVLRPARVRAYGFRTLSQLRIHYQTARPCTRASRPSAADRGPGIGPDAHIVDDGRECWLKEALATPTYHLLLRTRRELEQRPARCPGRAPRRPRRGPPPRPRNDGRRPSRRPRRRSPGSASSRRPSISCGPTATSATAAGLPTCAASSATSHTGSHVVERARAPKRRRALADDAASHDAALAVG